MSNYATEPYERFGFVEAEGNDGVDGRSPHNGLKKYECPHSCPPLAAVLTKYRDRDMQGFPQARKSFELIEHMPCALSSAMVRPLALVTNATS